MRISGLVASLSCSSPGVTLLTILVAFNIVFVVYMDMRVTGVVYSALISGALVSMALIAYVVSGVGLHYSKAVAKKLVAYVSPLILASLGAFFVAYADNYFLRVDGGLVEFFWINHHATRLYDMRRQWRWVMVIGALGIATVAGGMMMPYGDWTYFGIRVAAFAALQVVIYLLPLWSDEDRRMMLAAVQKLTRRFRRV